MVRVPVGSVQQWPPPHRRPHPVPQHGGGTVWPSLGSCRSQDRKLTLLVLPQTPDVAWRAVRASALSQRVLTPPSPAPAVARLPFGGPVRRCLRMGKLRHEELKSLAHVP